MEDGGAGLPGAQGIEVWKGSSHRLRNSTELSAEGCEAWVRLGDPPALSVMLPSTVCAGRSNRST